MKDTELLGRLELGPVFLFLGQSYMEAATGVDPLLEEIVRRYGDQDAPRRGNEGYSVLIDSRAADEPDAALPWLLTRARRIHPQDALDPLASYSWNGVYTSAIDNVFVRALERPWREVQRIYDPVQHYPSSSRSQTRLNVTFLFGALDAEPSYQPPLSSFDLATKRASASQLLQRLPELVTPLGSLLIDGYAPEKDWLQPETLYAVLQRFAPEQVHLFNADERLLSNRYIKRLAGDSYIVPHSESLSATLGRAQSAGLIRNGANLQQEHGRVISLESGPRTLPLSLWNTFSRSGTIVDDQALLPPRELSKERLYQEFRDFLEKAGRKPVWTGYARGFAFYREFEDELIRRIAARLSSPSPPDHPLILYGQSGTGKTVALGSIAYRIRKERKYPVLFIERSPTPPNFSDVTGFCDWTSDVGAPAALILWDGLTHEDEYNDLLRLLNSRGRHAVVVGTSYREPSERLLREAVEASAALGEEFGAFIAHLERLEEAFGLLLQKTEYAKDESFLVSLYRLLPPTRSRIQEGLLAEVESAERYIRNSLQQQHAFRDNVLAAALFDAGLISERNLLGGSVEVEGETVSEFDHLVSSIMVPGQFGLTVPIELLLRLTPSVDPVAFARSLEESGLFEWFDSETGQISIGPRHALEATILTKARLGGAFMEVEYACRLFREMRVNGSDAELDFAVEFVRSLGPRGQFPAKYREYWGRIASALRELRETKSASHPRLMLQEATLLTQRVADANRNSQLLDDWQEQLGQAEEALNDALELTTEQALLPHLHTQAASVAGTRIRTLIDHKPPAHSNDRQIHSLFEHVREHVHEALRLDPASVYALDVLAWVTSAVIEAAGDFGFSSTKMAEMEADLLHLFAVVGEQDLHLAQEERFAGRYQYISELLGRTDLADAAFEKLREMGSGVGYILRAWKLVSSLPFDRALTEEEIARCTEGLEYLRQNESEIASDGRALYLLLKLYWASHEERGLFAGERLTTHFDQREWSFVLGLLNRIVRTDTTVDALRLQYLQALCHFHLRDTPVAFELFNRLRGAEAAAFVGKRRVIRSYLASHPDGSPAVYTGTVTSVHADRRRGEVFVEELQRPIPFFLGEFMQPDIARGQTLGRFHIAFNYLGPIADPVHRFQSLHGR